MKILLTILFSIFFLPSNAQEKRLTKQQITDDLSFLRRSLNERSSYAYLNGYDFNSDFDHYLGALSNFTMLEDFALFLTETIGKMGDRHSSVNGYKIRDSIFLPFMYAPENHKVRVLKRGVDSELRTLNPKFPYLTKIDGIPITPFLKQIIPGQVTAPKDAYFTNAVRELRDIQKMYTLLKRALPSEIKLTLSDSLMMNDTVLTVSPVSKSMRSSYWDEKQERRYALTRDEDYNKPEFVQQLFAVKNQIAYIQIPAMVSKQDAPLFFEELNLFMKSAQNTSKALIVDVRSNGGGTRDITYELAKYFVHPDSVYVVNVTRQRAPTPLPEEYKESLHSRNLFSFSELDSREQKSVTGFLKTFKPVYELEDRKYSEYYFGLFNGKKLSERSVYYNKPVYVLANEKSFSAASVFVAAFKGIPAITVAGVTTDGSSGNSERIELPDSKLSIKISTMVSFQKDGKILDGFGTSPDIKIERDLDQILWKADTQLEKLRTLILKNN